MTTSSATSDTVRRRLIGPRDGRLTGPECRALRATINLERRHVTALANAIGLSSTEVMTSQVSGWERSSKDGYPEALTTAMEKLEGAVQGLACDLRAEALLDQLITPGVLYVKRPPVGRYDLAALDLDGAGLELDDRAREILEQCGGDFWQALCDAAVNRAVLHLADQNPVHFIRVVVAREQR